MGMRRYSPWVVVDALNKTSAAATEAAASATDFVNINASYNRAGPQGKAVRTTGVFPLAPMYDKLAVRLTKPTGINNITSVTVELLAKVNEDADDIITVGTWTWGATAQVFTNSDVGNELTIPSNYVQLYTRISAFAGGASPTISFKTAIAGFYQER